jgi:hypothetical protein
MVLLAARRPPIEAIVDSMRSRPSASIVRSVTCSRAGPQTFAAASVGFFFLYPMKLAGSGLILNSQKTTREYEVHAIVDLNFGVWGTFGVQIHPSRLVASEGGWPSLSAPRLAIPRPDWRGNSMSAGR